MTDPYVSYDDRSGPPPYIPVSGAAVTALVLSVVLFFIALFGPWWVEIVPVLLVLLSWGAISRRARRGRPVAIIALVLALLGGGAAYAIQAAISTFLGTNIAPIVAALERGDRAAVGRWVPEDAPDREAKIDRWIARAKSAHDAKGAFSGECSVPFSLWGVFGGLIAKPDVREELEPREATPIQPSSTIWFKAKFANGDVYVGFDCGSAENLAKANQDMKSAGSAEGDQASTGFREAIARKVQEIRYFR